MIQPGASDDHSSPRAIVTPRGHSSSLSSSSFARARGDRVKKSRNGLKTRNVSLALRTMEHDGAKNGEPPTLWSARTHFSPSLVVSSLTSRFYRIFAARVSTRDTCFFFFFFFFTCAGFTESRGAVLLARVRKNCRLSRRSRFTRGKNGRKNPVISFSIKLFRLLVNYYNCGYWQTTKSEWHQKH